MTTPERMRRRQRITGVFLLLLGVFTVALAIYFQAQDTKQRADIRRQQDCIASNFTQLSASLSARAELAARDSALASRESAATERVVLSVAKAADPVQVRAALDAFVVEQAEIAADREKVSDVRRKTPVPPFPVGTCG